MFEVWEIMSKQYGNGWKVDKKFSLRDIEKANNKKH
jgi:hypothetical protein